MNKNARIKWLLNLSKLLESSMNTVQELNEKLSSDDYTDYESKVYDLAHTTEKAVLNARKYASETLTQKLSLELGNRIIKDVYHIDIKRNTDGIYSISMPSLTYYRQGGEHENVLVKPLMLAFEDYRLNQELVRFDEKVVLCYENVVKFDNFNYKGTPAQKGIPDTDNYMYRKITNVINTYLLVEDNMIYCDFFATSRPATEGEESHCKIWVVPEKIFPQWYQKHFHSM